MAGGAGVDAAAQISFLHNRRAAAGAGLAVGLRAQAHLVTAGLPEKVFFGAAPAGLGHFPQGQFQADVKLLQFCVREGVDFAAGVQARFPEDILQAAIAQPRDALLGCQSGFQRQLAHRLGGEQRAKIGFAESF